MTPLYGAVAGAVVGAIFGAWTAAAHAPGATVTVAAAAPPSETACPDGYLRDPALDPGATVEGTRVRWLARCDPRVSGFAISESLELLWSADVYVDGRAQLESLRDLLGAVGRSGSLLLEPLGAPQLRTIAGVRAQSIDVNASYRVPPLAVRAWLLPAGSNTLEVTLVSSRARLESAAGAARGAIDAIEGLAAPPASDADAGAPPPQHAARGFSARNVRCPAGYTDATPPDGGPGRSVYVGRYCLSPDEHGGVELTFAEVTARVDSPESARRLLELTAARTQVVGVATGAGFDAPQPVRVRDLAGYTAVMNVDPPPARVRLRGYVAPAGDATVYGLATFVPEHADASAGALERWMAAAGRVRPIDQGTLRTVRVDRAVKTIVIPSALTAALGAMLVALFKKR